MAEFSLSLNDDQLQIQSWVHEFAETVIRPNGEEWDEREETPWPIIQEAAKIGLYSMDFMAQALMGDPTGLTLPVAMEELFWGCAGIGLTIVLPALALAAIRQAASDEQLIEWAPQCFGTPDEIKLAALAVTEPSGGSDIRSIQTRARSDGSAPYLVALTGYGQDEDQRLAAAAGFDRHLVKPVDHDVLEKLLSRLPR